MSEEIWKPVKGYEGVYSVSNWGNVRSEDRISKQGKTPRFWKWRTLKPSYIGAGYAYYDLCFEGTRKGRHGHILVAEAFIGPRPEGMEVCHNDGNPSNNHVDNLRYGTRSENARDAVKHGTHRNTRVEKCPRGHLYAEGNYKLSELKLGGRQCRSCTNAREYLARNGQLNPEALQKVSDQYYEKYVPESVRLS